MSFGISNRSAIVAGLCLALALLTVTSAATGMIDLDLSDALRALAGGSTEYNRSLVLNIRLPRILAGAAIGVALSVSGLLTSTALRNPLADSGILGIQSGATVGALTAILVYPELSSFFPVFAFAGGFAAFAILIFVSSTAIGFQPARVVLLGVAINSVGTAIIGIITLLNVHRVRDAMAWLNGSLAAVSRSQMSTILVYTAALATVAVLLIPVLKLLLLEDHGIVNLGYNPTALRMIVSAVAVFLAGIAVAYAGIIAFIGIIAPQLARRMVGENLSWLLPTTALTGAILVVAADLLQRVVFAPREVPVGILIGVLGAPMFIALSRRV